MLYFILLMAVIITLQLFGPRKIYKAIKKSKTVLIAFCINIPIACLSIYYNHSTAEKQWADWKAVGMDVYHKAYKEAQSRGLDSVESEKYALKVLDIRGYERPGICIYCRMKSWTK